MIREKGMNENISRCATLAALLSAGGAAALTCIPATPTVTEGPYWVDEKLFRSDIRTDPPRVSPERALRRTSYNSGGGTGTVVTSGQKFLRGYQVTDENGQVKFTAIYPGWYMGRTIHIHVQVRTTRIRRS